MKTTWSSSSRKGGSISDGDVRIVQDSFNPSSGEAFRFPRGAGLINEGDGIESSGHDEPYSLLRDPEFHAKQSGLVWQWYRARAWLYDLFYGERLRSSIYEWVMQCVTFINVGNFIWSTVAVPFNTEDSKTGKDLAPFLWVDTATVLLFTIDYILRFWCIVERPTHRHWLKGRIRWIFSGLSLIDLISFLPFYIGLSYDYGSSNHFMEQSYSEFRGFRVFRILRSKTYWKALITLKKVIVENQQVLLTVLFTAIAVLLLHATLMWYAMRHSLLPDFESIVTTMWISMLQLSGVGGFDNYPFTVTAKLLSSFSSIFAIAIFAIPAGVIASGFQRAWERAKKKAEAEKKRALREQERAKAEARLKLRGVQENVAKTEYPPRTKTSGLRSRKQHKSRPQQSLGVIEKLTQVYECKSCSQRFKVVPLQSLLSLNEK